MAATKQALAFTDFEEGIMFDDDDPDFHGSVANTRHNHAAIHQHSIDSSDSSFSININRHVLSFAGHDITT
ncbi:uncharacterized protein LOC142318137 isoform X2 [Lycorma delicatula]|uniref:uncharacterized protein LOC142318137 isoform X2 n=1 Tax=Lycorma delicatula TaxID=130591 RepID=UPI003F519600